MNDRREETEPAPLDLTKFTIITTMLGLTMAVMSSIQLKKVSKQIR